MASLKNLLKGKKKSNDKDKKGSLHRSSTGNLSTSSSKGSQLNLTGSTDSLGYLLKEKDLSKFLKAAWQGDAAKLKQLTNKKTNFNETDKEQRFYVFCFSLFNLLLFSFSLKVLLFPFFGMNWLCK